MGLHMLNIKYAYVHNRKLDVVLDIKLNFSRMQN
jgi:hypothetical protein